MSPPRPSRARTANRPAPEDQALLLQFVVLSLLLHILVVLVFGSRTAGSDRRGDGAPGSLDVTLRRLSPEPGTGFTLAPGADSPSAGSALLRRLLGKPAPPAKAALPVPAAAPEAPPSAPAVTPAAAPAPVPALPHLNREAQEEIDRPLTPPAAAPPIERERVPAVDPVPLTAPSAATPQVDIAPREVPLPAPIERVTPAKSRPALLPPIDVPPPAPIERIAPAKSRPDLLPPIELPAPAPIERIAPAKSRPDLLPPIELPAPAPIERIAPATSRPDLLPPIELPAPAPIERIAPATSRPDLLPPIELPAPAPIERIAPAKNRPEPLPPIELPPPAPVERIAPATIRPDVLAPIAPPPRETPLSAPAEQYAPPRVERPLAPPAAAPAPASETLDTAPRAPRAAPAGVGSDRAPAREATPRSGSSPAGAAPAARGGIPDAEEEAFKPRGDVVDPTTVPRIDLEATRQRAREIAREPPASRGLLLVVPTPPDAVKRKPTLAEAMAKAVKPDCRDAYADLGLLAIPPLVASTIGNGGCRW